jgi:hypothetical protein
VARNRGEYSVTWKRAPRNLLAFDPGSLKPVIKSYHFTGRVVGGLCSVEAQPDGVHLTFAQCDKVWHGAIGFGACHVFAAPAYEIGTAPACHATAAMCAFNPVRDVQPDNVILLYKPATRVGFPHITALPYGEARRKAGLTKFP